jgi:7-cyano-7-deazaguanine synthase in queuosine biosynthesis
MTVGLSPGTARALYTVPGKPPQPVQLGEQALLDGHAVIHRLARALTPKSADLVEIAVTIYLVDQLVARPAERTLSDGSTWARDLGLQIPVREPQLWSRHAGSLMQLLAWLTDDRWDLEFVQRATGTGPLDTREAFLFDTVPAGAAPVLFSGGLDSAAGLAAHLSQADAVAISVETSNWMQHVQQRVVRELSRASQHACVPLRYRVSLHQQKHPAESSQRSRGLLFLAAGIATAWTLGQDRVQVFENGIGAINLPYLRSQYRSQAARAMHPRTLRMAQDLAAAVSGRPFRIDAPGMTLTKAQLIRRAPGAADAALGGTVSCDKGFSARVARHAPCGKCTSCLLRRQALHAAGKSALDAAAGYRTASPGGSRELQAMLWQMNRLRDCLAHPDPWHGLVLEYPELLDTAPLTSSEVISLYRSYVREWEGIPEALGIGRTAAL